jgi:hypothetical protein
MAEIGSPVGRSIVAKIEGAGREVSIDEVVAYAYALGVPPLSLLLPLSNEGDVEIAGSVTVPVGHARAWWREANPLTDGNDVKARTFFYEASDQLLMDVGRRLVEALVIYRLATDLISEGVDDPEQVKACLTMIERNARAGLARLRGNQRAKSRLRQSANRRARIKTPPFRS